MSMSHNHQGKNVSDRLLLMSRSYSLWTRIQPAFIFLLATGTVFVSWATSYQWVALGMLVCLLCGASFTLQVFTGLPLKWIVVAGALILACLYWQRQHQIDSPDLLEYCEQGAFFALAFIIARAGATRTDMRAEATLLLWAIALAAAMHLGLWCRDIQRSSISLAGFLHQPEMIKEVARVGRKNLAGAIICGMICAGFAATASQTSKRFRAWLTVLVLFAFALGLTDTRAAYISLIVPIGFWLIRSACCKTFSRSSEALARRKAWRLTLVIALLVFAASSVIAGFERYAVLSNSLGQAFHDSSAIGQQKAADGNKEFGAIFDPATFAPPLAKDRVTGKADVSIILRVSWLIAATRSFLRVPLGQGVHDDLVYRVARTFNPAARPEDTYGGGLHSIALNFVVMFGIAGLIVALGTFFLLVRYVWRFFPTQPAQVAIVLCGMSMLTRLCIDQFDYSLTLMLAILTGWASAILTDVETRRKQNDNATVQHDNIAQPTQVHEVVVTEKGVV